MEPSVKQIVLAAYQLDNYGDLGDAEKAQEAFRSLSTAIAQLDSIVWSGGDDACRADGARPRSARAGAGAAHRRAQRHHIEIHVQRRGVSGSAESVRTLPHRRRCRADVAAQIRGCISVGRITARGAAAAYPGVPADLSAEALSAKAEARSAKAEAQSARSTLTIS